MPKQLRIRKAKKAIIAQKPDEPQKEVVEEVEIIQSIKEHVRLKDVLDSAKTAREKETTFLKDNVDTYGVTDKVGSITYYKEENGKAYIAKNTARVATILLPEATDLCKAKKELQGYVTTTSKTVTTDVLDEVKLQADILSGKIPVAVAKRLYATATTYALTTSIKDVK